MAAYTAKLVAHKAEMEEKAKLRAGTRWRKDASARQKAAPRRSGVYEGKLRRAAREAEEAREAEAEAEQDAAAELVVAQLAAARAKTGGKIPVAKMKETKETKEKKETKEQKATRSPTRAPTRGSTRQSKRARA